MSIYFGEDKTKCLLFDTKLKLNKVNRLDIRFEEIHIKKYHTVTDLLLVSSHLAGCSVTP